MVDFFGNRQRLRDRLLAGLSAPTMPDWAQLTRDPRDQPNPFAGRVPNGDRPIAPPEYFDAPPGYVPGPTLSSGTFGQQQPPREWIFDLLQPTGGQPEPLDTGYTRDSPGGPRPTHPSGGAGYTATERTPRRVDTGNATSVRRPVDTNAGGGGVSVPMYDVGGGAGGGGGGGGRPMQDPSLLLQDPRMLWNVALQGQGIDPIRYMRSKMGQRMGERFSRLMQNALLAEGALGGGQVSSLEDLVRGYAGQLFGQGGGQFTANMADLGRRGLQAAPGYLQNAQEDDVESYISRFAGLSQANAAPIAQQAALGDLREAFDRHELAEQYDPRASGNLLAAIMASPAARRLGLVPY